MSRRRKPPMPAPGSPSDAIPAYLVAVRCTDRGQHPRAAIALLGQFVGLDDVTRVLWQKAGHPDPLTGWQQPDGSRTFRFACPRCALPNGKMRNVELREPNVLRFMDAMRAASNARPVIDLSMRAPLLC